MTKRGEGTLRHFPARAQTSGSPRRTTHQRFRIPALDPRRFRTCWPRSRRFDPCYCQARRESCSPVQGQMPLSRPRPRPRQRSSRVERESLVQHPRGGSDALETPGVFERLGTSLARCADLPPDVQLSKPVAPAGEGASSGDERERVERVWSRTVTAESNTGPNGRKRFGFVSEANRANPRAEPLSARSLQVAPTL